MAVDNLSFIGVGRFRGYWNASTNSGTLTADGGYDSDRASGVPLLNTGSVYGYASSSIGAFHTASSGGGAALTASAGDYFQVSVGAPTVVDSENGWEANDYILLKSGSSGEEFKWIRLSYTDTVSSVIQGGLNSSSLADELLELSGVADTQVLTARVVDGTSSFSGSSNLVFKNSTNELVLTGSLIVSGAVQANQFNTTVVETTILFKSGSTKFGDDSNDKHHFTGSVFMGHNLYVTGNIDANGTITCDDSITVDSVTITDTELGYLDGLTLGTVAASKVVTADANKDFSGFRNISGSGIIESEGSISSSGDLAVTGAVHANKFYGNTAYLSTISGTNDGDPADINLNSHDDVTINTAQSLKAQFKASSTILGNAGLAAYPTYPLVIYAGQSASFVATGSAGQAWIGYPGAALSALENVGHTDGDYWKALNVSGSSKFGNLSGHKHHFTGSVFVGNELNISGAISASSVVADGTNFKMHAPSNFIIHLDEKASTGDSNFYLLQKNNAYFFRAVTNDNTSRVEIGAPLTASFGLSSSAGTIVSVGSISSSGDLAITGAVHANAYYGNGSGLTGVGISGSSRHYSETGLETSGYLKVSGSSTLGHTLPIADITYDLGSADKRWRNIYTGDLHLKNDRGDWTVIEEEDYLTITNNKNGKRYKLLMEEI